MFDTDTHTHTIPHWYCRVCYASCACHVTTTSGIAPVQLPYKLSQLTAREKNTRQLSRISFLPESTGSTDPMNRKLKVLWVRGSGSLHMYFCPFVGFRAARVLSTRKWKRWRALLAKDCWARILMFSSSWNPQVCACCRNLHRRGGCVVA